MLWSDYPRSYGATLRLKSSKLGVLAVLRLDGDEMTADPDDGNAGDASKTYMAICSTSDEVGDIIG